MLRNNARRSIARRIATGAPLALGLQLPTVSRAGCDLKTLELPVRMVSHRAIATVGINGTTVPLLVDSGAFFSFLTEAAAQQLGLPTRQLPGSLRIEGLTGGVTARLTTVAHLQMADGDLPGVDCAQIRRSRHQRDATLDDLSTLDRTLPPQSQIRSSMALLYERHDVALEPARNGRSWARVELGIELDKALDDCDAAVGADSKNASFLDSRAWVYLRQGQGKPRKAQAAASRGNEA